METTKPEDRDHNPAPELGSGGAVRRGQILAPLSGLIGELSRVRGIAMPPGPEGEPPTHWGDDENVYMSFDLEGQREIDLDISVCYGKVYIRVAR